MQGMMHVRGRFTWQVPVLPCVASMTMLSMERVSMSGQMEEYTLENGPITRWRAMVLSQGLVAEASKVSILMI